MRQNTHHHETAESGSPTRRTVLRNAAAFGVGSTVVGTGTAAADSGRSDDNPGRGDDQRRTCGRICKLGHEFPEGDLPRYTYGHVRQDGMYGAVGSFPRLGNNYGSTLYDLEDLENPVEVHRLESPNPITRTNHLRFDGTRNGLYYRTWEADEDPDETEALEGFEVIDYGWGDGTPEDPESIGEVHTPNTGVHTLAEHPEEEVIYAVDDAEDIPGVIPVDVSDPTDPQITGLVGPPGDCHDCEVDPVRDVLHCAYIGGEFEGYAILDLSDPLYPEELARFDYAEQPNYTEIGEPGFESCHQAQFDPERDIAVVGDELCGLGVPGGKHIFDIGWGDGSLEDPQPIGFTHAPDAREHAENNIDCACFWTTHFHDVVHKGDEVLLVDGGYREGTWVANITDPTNPIPTERYATDDVDIDETEDHYPYTPPYCWSAVYNEERDFVFSSDTLTGAYTFRVFDRPARGRDGGGPRSNYDLEEILNRSCEP